MTETYEQLPIAHHDVIFRRVADGAVLLSLQDEVYYGLNAVGARVWELLQEQSHGFEQIVEAIHLEHREVPRATIADDLNDLLRDFTNQGLVRIPDPLQGEPGLGAASPPVEDDLR